jgi:hypothetical protein
VILPLYNSLAPLTINRLSAAVPALLPTDLPNLRFWLDATTGLFDATSGGSAVTTDNSAVARWEDQSGNSKNFTQATLNSRPVLKTAALNGKNVIEFDGSNDLLRDATSESAYASIGYAYIFAVLKDTNRTAGNAWHVPVFIGRNNFGGSRFSLKTRYIGTNIFAGSFRKNAEALTVISDTSDANFNVLSYILKFSDGSHSLRKNQSQIASGTFTAGAAANVNSFGRAIGCLDNAFSGFFFPGQVGEVFVGTGQLTQGQIDGAEQYLKNKWGL